jgi:hypothetical protein
LECDHVHIHDPAVKVNGMQITIVNPREGPLIEYIKAQKVGSEPLPLSCDNEGCVNSTADTLVSEHRRVGYVVH